MHETCGWCDGGCSECGGISPTTLRENDATHTLWRIDMDDVSGTPFCGPCGEDALETGVFRAEGYRELVVACGALADRFERLEAFYFKDRDDKPEGPAGEVTRARAAISKATCLEVSNARDKGN